MHGQLDADLLDRGQKTFSEIASAKMRGKARGHAIPELLPNLFMNSAVAEHDETAARWNDEDQDSVVLAGMRDAQTHEGFLRSLFDVAPEEPGYGHRDLAGR